MTPENPAPSREPHATFKLKCVGCGTVEERDARECEEQPFCEKCYMPMVLTEAKVSR